MRNRTSDNSAPPPDHPKRPQPRPQQQIEVVQTWTSVARWTICGTLACVAVAVTFNAILFGDQSAEIMRRALISGTVLPIMMGLPLFIIMSLRMRGLALTNRRLGLIARTDSLTACLNRGAFTTRVNAALSRRPNAPHGAMLMIDADNFKAINDLYGHDAGDEALAIIARSIRAILRSGDLVGRMGGEEFGVYLPGVDVRNAEAIAERIRRSVNLAVFTPNGRLRPLSVSIGGAVFNQLTSFSELFRIADQRLYGAKQGGRNRVTIVHVTDHVEGPEERRA